MVNVIGWLVTATPAEVKAVTLTVAEVAVIGNVKGVAVLRTEIPVADVVIVDTVADAVETA